MFILNSIYNVPLNTIFTSEGFEDLPRFRGFFKNDNGSLKRKSILISRTLILMFTFALTWLTEDLTVIFDLGGGIFCPLLSYIFPIWWARRFEQRKKLDHKRTKFEDVMDQSTLIFGYIVTVFANYFGIKEAFSSAPDH